jgi:hypothetical protein
VRRRANQMGCKMRASRLVVASMLVVGLVGCSGDKDRAMPDVAGKKLDAALSDIKQAGFKDDVDVDGGGAFGIIDKSNWEVCEQTPAAGEALTKAPRLKVERDCNKQDDEPSEQPSAEPSPEPEPTGIASPTAKPTLTVENSPQLKALLQVDDPCDDKVASFAAKYDGTTIEFDASVADVANHGSYETRYDFLIAPGDKGPQSTRGPSFKFEDVNYTDLHVTNAGDRSSVSEGDLLRVVAKVDNYNPTQCLFFLEPVRTAFR